MAAAATQFLLTIVIALLSITTPVHGKAYCDGYNALWLAIDVSGSVDSTEMAMQVDGYDAGLQNIIPTFQWGTIAIGVSVFARTAQTIFPMRKIGNQADLTAVREAILQLKTNRFVDSSATAVGDAVTQAAADFGHNAWRDCPNRVLDVSTDGWTNHGSEPTPAVIAANQTYGIKTNCLGIASSATCEWATDGGGLAFMADTFAKVQSTLQVKLKEELVIVTMTLPPTPTTSTSLTPSVSKSVTETARSRTKAKTPSVSLPITPSMSTTLTPSVSLSQTKSPSVSASITASHSSSRTASHPPTLTPSSTLPESVSSTILQTATPTHVSSATASASLPLSASASLVQTASATHIPTATPTTSFPESTSMSVSVSSTVPPTASKPLTQSSSVLLTASTSLVQTPTVSAVLSTSGTMSSSTSKSHTGSSTIPPTPSASVVLTASTSLVQTPTASEVLSTSTSVSATVTKLRTASLSIPPTATAPLTPTRSVPLTVTTSLILTITQSVILTGTVSVPSTPTATMPPTLTQEITATERLTHSESVSSTMVLTKTLTHPLTASNIQTLTASMPQTHTWLLTASASLPLTNTKQLTISSSQTGTTTLPLTNTQQLSGSKTITESSTHTPRIIHQSHQCNVEDMCYGRGTTVRYDETIERCVCGCETNWAPPSCHWCPYNYNASKNCNECAYGFEIAPTCFCSRHVVAEISIVVPETPAVTSYLSALESDGDNIHRLREELLVQAVEEDITYFLNNSCALAPEFKEMLLNTTVFKASAERLPTTGSSNKSVALSFSVDLNPYASIGKASCSDVEAMARCIKDSMENCLGMPVLSKMVDRTSTNQLVHCAARRVDEQVKSPCSGEYGCAAAEEENFAPARLSGAPPEENNLALIIGIIVGLLLLLCLIVAAVIGIRRYRAGYRGITGIFFADPSRYTKRFNVGVDEDDMDMDATIDIQDVRGAGEWEELAERALAEKFDVNQSPKATQQDDTLVRMMPDKDDVYAEHSAPPIVVDIGKEPTTTKNQERPPQQTNSDEDLLDVDDIELDDTVNLDDTLVLSNKPAPAPKKQPPTAKKPPTAPPKKAPPKSVAPRRGGGGGGGLTESIGSTRVVGRVPIDIEELEAIEKRARGMSTYSDI